MEENVDCTSCSLIAQDIVWFQCPWLLDLDKIGQLLRDFLQNMNEQQNCPNYVFIGFTSQTTEKYTTVHTYQIEQLLAYAPTVGYKFIGADNSFIKEMLAHGYRHKCTDENLDFHERLFHAHATLVFEKK